MNFKTIAWLLAITLILFSIYSVIQTGDYWTKKKAFKEESQLRAKEITLLERQKSGLLLEVGILVSEANKEKGKRIKLEKERQIDKQKLYEAQAKVAKMKADKVVTETVYLLEVDTNSLWKNVDGIQFTLDVAKVNLSALYEWEHYKEEEIPRYKKEIVTWKTEVGSLRLAIIDYGQAMEKAEGIIRELETQIKADAEILKECEKELKKFDWKLAGGTAIIVGGIILILK